MDVHAESGPRRHRLTVDEYYRMAQVGLLPPDARVELIEGEIIDMPPIGNRHAAVVDRLAKRLIQAIGESAYLRIQGPVRLSAHSEPQPDLVLLQPRSDEYTEAHPTATDVLLVIEVSDSTLHYDLNDKAMLYARYGVPELWILDLEHGQLHGFRHPREGGYAERFTAAPETMHLPGLHVPIDLSRLF